MRGLDTQNALLHGCCTKALEHAGTISCSSRFTCKTGAFRSGPEGTRTPDLRHARAALSRLSYGPPGASAILAAGLRIARQGAKGVVTPSSAFAVLQPTIVYADVQGSSGALAPES
jgi:hypothetical protein